MEQKINILYGLLEKLEDSKDKNDDEIAALRWAIFELEKR